ncbi:MAG: hypothetical protein FWH19_00320 [Treponema sp.]|nr:hypothetical protein [Treponema sp.]
MRIDNILPPVYMQNQVLNYNLVPASEIQNQARPGGIVVDISPAAWAAYEQSRANGTLNPAGAGRGLDATDPTQCATCDSRRYQDVSDDSSVSFQAPTHISPGASAALVAAHEGEHVANEQAKASQEGREIVSQSVRLFTSICPECGRMYVSGGETRTLSASKPEESAEPAPEGSTGPTA